jgi:hypothetical protein
VFLGDQDHTANFSLLLTFPQELIICSQCEVRQIPDAFGGISASRSKCGWAGCVSRGGCAHNRRGSPDAHGASFLLEFPDPPVRVSPGRRRATPGKWSIERERGESELGDRYSEDPEYETDDIGKDVDWECENSEQRSGKVEDMDKDRG